MAFRKPKVALIVLAFNGIDLTLEVLECISRLSVDGLDIFTIVVDNASKDDTQERLKNFKLANMPFIFIKNGKNLGFAGGNNVGIRYALNKKADYVFLLNNDITFSSNAVDVLVKEAMKDERIGMISPKMYFAKGYEFHKDRYQKDERGKVIWYAGGEIDRNNVYSFNRGVDEVDKGQYEKMQKTDCANAAFVLYNAKMLEDVGILDEKLFLYWEDADLSERARKKGWKVYYCPKTSIWHKVSVASGGPGGEVNDYFLTRNRMIFGFRYSSLRTKFALIRDSIRILLNGKKWQKKGILDFYMGVRYGGSKIK